MNNTIHNILKEHYDNPFGPIGWKVFVEEIKQVCYKKNQFVEFQNGFKEALQKVYKEYISSNEDDKIELYSQRVSEIVLRFSDFEKQEGPVVCEEYSPEMQMEILGLDLETIKQPVLDIGCGETGGITRYLRKAGISAFGMDRIVEKEKFLIQADWLKTKFGKDKWGTVISHMAFTNHFIFQHKYVGGKPEEYAQAYMEILGSLKVGGEFYYTPDLPFIETILPKDKYSITKKAIRDDIYSVRITRLK